MVFLLHERHRCVTRAHGMAAWGLCSPWLMNTQLLFFANQQHGVDWTRRVIHLLLGLDALPRAEESTSQTGIPSLPAVGSLLPSCPPRTRLHFPQCQQGHVLRHQLDGIVNTES